MMLSLAEHGLPEHLYSCPNCPLNSNMDAKIEVVYNSSGAAVSQVDLSPYPFGVYLIIAYRFIAVIWRWSNSMRFKTIEKEDSVELTANGLILRFNYPIEYVAVIKIWG